MRDDERRLLAEMQLTNRMSESPRAVAERLGIPRKRYEYIFGKWAAKRWYDYGVCVDMGWLEPAGYAIDTM